MRRIASMGDMPEPEHAAMALDESMGAAVGRLTGNAASACVVDPSELGSAAARRRSMAVRGSPLQNQYSSVAPVVVRLPDHGPLAAQLEKPCARSSAWIEGASRETTARLHCPAAPYTRPGRKQAVRE